jgi:hypothetical protein
MPHSDLLVIDQENHPTQPPTHFPTLDIQISEEARKQVIEKVGRCEFAFVTIHVTISKATLLESCYRVGPNWIRKYDSGELN